MFYSITCNVEAQTMFLLSILVQQIHDDCTMYLLLVNKTAVFFRMSLEYMFFSSGNLVMPHIYDCCVQQKQINMKVIMKGLFC